VIPPVGGYSIYYHKLTIDRLGNLYVSYNHWSDHAYSKDFPGLYHNRAMITSTDGGETWKLAEAGDFVAAARAWEQR
jgi:Neuraminidase (sialidase)